MIRPQRFAPWVIALLPVAAVLTAVLVGRYGVHLPDTIRVLLGLDGPSATFRAVILRVRLPRAVAAACVGANLAVVGAVFQGMFRNPLVDSRILGVSSGAAFGAALALLMTRHDLLVQMSAFAFALIAVACVLVIGTWFGSSTLVIVIAGILVGALFNSVLGLIQYVADPLSTLPAITYWLLGGLSDTLWSDLPVLLTITGVGQMFFLALRWRLNLMTLSHREAHALGIRIRPLRALFVIIGTLMIAASVSVAGMVGWIGLVIPHAARAVVGPNHPAVIPASAALGATTLILLDIIARTAVAVEIPLGILTGLIGVPAFLLVFYHFLRSRGALA